MNLRESISYLRDWCIKAKELQALATPGPWTVDDLLCIGTDGGRHGYREISGGGMFWIARVQGFNRGDNLEAYTANAAVVASSRNFLLPLVRFVEDTLDEVGEHCDCEDLQDTRGCDSCNRVIALAESLKDAKNV